MVGTVSISVVPGLTGTKMSASDPVSTCCDEMSTRICYDEYKNMCYGTRTHTLLTFNNGGPIALLSDKCFLCCLPSYKHLMIMSAP